MDNRTFTNSLEEIYGKSLSIPFLGALNDGLKFISKRTMKEALRKIPQKYSTMPSVKNILDICKAIQEENRKNNFDIESKNDLTPESLGISEEVFISWFAPLRIKKEKDTVKIASTRNNELFEYWVITYFKENLRLALGDNVRKISWYRKTNNRDSYKDYYF